MTAPRPRPTRPVFFSADRDAVRESIADAAAVAVRAAVRGVTAAVERLDAIDPERAHGEADEVLLSVVPPEVRDAYQRLVARCSWWATS